MIMISMNLFSLKNTILLKHNMINLNQLSDSFFVSLIEKELNLKFNNYKVKRDIAFDHVKLCIYHDSLTNGSGNLATVYLKQIQNDIVVSISIQYGKKKNKCLKTYDKNCNELVAKALFYTNNFYFFLSKQYSKEISFGNHLIINPILVTTSFVCNDIASLICFDKKHYVSSSYSLMFEAHKLSDLFNDIDNQYNAYFLENGIDAKDMGYKEKFELFEMMMI